MTCFHRRRRSVIRAVLVLAAVTVAIAAESSAPLAQTITARVRPALAPAWNKGIQPVNAESYYNAIECGKQGGDDSPCVFWDTGLCANTDFTLAWYTGYKQVAYEVWTAVRRKQPLPKPNFQAAQRQRVTIAVTQAKGATNALKELTVKRGGKPAVAFERSLASGGGRFTFDYPAFAPTADVTIELVGQQKTLACLLPQAVLRQLR
jgi:hypothetical protein